MALEVRVNSAATGGLEIIGQIPSVRPCRLEGRNGIGKSALIRLLVLLSGEQPYPTDAASWRSMRHLIGETEVYITGLEGSVREAAIRLTPTEWPEDPPPSKIENWLGVLTLDGTEAPVEELFGLLHVVHLSGTERLADTLANQSDRLAAALADVEVRLDGLTEERVELGRLADDLQFLSAAEAQAEARLLESETAKRRRVASDLEQIGPKAEELNKAYVLAAMVESGDAAKHERRLAELRTELEDARARMDVAVRNRDLAVAALDKGSTAQRQVARRERRLAAIQKLMDQLVVRQEELGARLEALGLAAGTELLDESQRGALDDEIARVTAHQRRLQVTAARNHRTGVENQVLDDVRVVLDDAVTEGLSDMILARVREQDISVFDLRDGLGFLTEIDDNELADLADATQELAVLSELKELFAQREKHLEESKKLRGELQDLESEAAAHDDLRNQATQAREVLDAVSAEVRAHNLEIGALSRGVLGGAEAVADVETHVRDLLANHGVELDELPSALAEVQSVQAQLQTQEEELKRNIDRLLANARRRRVSRESLRRQCEHEDGPRWLADLAARMSSGDTAPGSGAGDWSDEIWQQLSDHVNGVRETYDSLRSQVSGLRDLASSGKLQSGPLGSALRAVVEAEAREELSAKPIADALFDGGEVVRVTLDDGASMITWTTPSGELRTRPLTAFSSGQQALGFVRARLQLIADQPTANRLVFLDEFGAFISADRRRPLAELLTSDALKALADQVVVVLPLQSDYANELSQTTGELKAQYTERAAEIEQHGYFTEQFSG